jgi:NitT/TauT family transport system ATP-binding protein
LIHLDNIGVTYQTSAGDHEALSEVDFKLRKGTSCVILGPTGCGKSTLLYTLAGLIRPASGSVVIDGEQLVSVRLSTSLILQQHGLFPWKNAFENIALGLTLRGVKRSRRNAITKELMKELNIWDVRQSFPGQLSGGQRQRVAIARSLATEPDLLLMDEPFSALDSMTRESLQNLVLDLWHARPITIVLVTHSIEEAVFLGRRIVILSPRPGRIVTILENPEMGERSYRREKAFYARCNEIRHIVEATK